MKKRTNVMNILMEIEEKLSLNTDFKRKTIMIGKGFTAQLIFLEVLLNKSDISDAVLKPLIQEEAFRSCESIEEIEQKIDDGAVYLSNCETADNAKDVITKIFNYNAAIFIEGASKVYLFEANTSNVRQISEPATESTTKGARDSFVETMNINLAMIRARLKTDNLVIEALQVGSDVPTKTALMYVKGITDMQIVERLRTVLQSEDIKTVAALGVIEEAVSGSQRSIFPQSMATERPDRLCSGLMEGYVGIMIDGFPFSLVTPSTLLTLMQAPEDYSRSSVISSILRILRFVMLFVSLSLPAIYISIMTFQHEMMPSTLAISIIQSRIEVPFDEAFETMIMLIAFEILIEASLRIPQNIGQTVSIVGGLIIGDAAVNAKIVSPSVVIVVAIAAISAFTIPNQSLSNSVRLWRFVLAVLSTFLGLFGFIIGLIILMLQLSSLETLGVPFLAPFVSRKTITKDTFIRRPFKDNRKKPQYLVGKGEENK